MASEIKTVGTVNSLALTGAAQSSKEVISIDNDSHVHIFNYDPMPGEGFIRTLSLLPGSGDEPIATVLQTVEVGNAANTYDALSYVWGDPHDVVDITCNGRSVAVTANLYHALQRLRDPDAARIYWIDALCINQTDNVEKGWHVQRMGDIYQDAARVFVWLGPDEHDRAAEIFAIIRSTVEYLESRLKEHGSLDNIPSDASDVPADLAEANWEIVRHMRTMSWFQRSWTVQEAGMAKECILIWGDSKLEYEFFMAFAIYNSWRTDLQPFRGELGLGRIVDCFSGIQCGYHNPISWRRKLHVLAEICDRRASQQFRFVAALSAARELQASNPRDKIYAFFGLPHARADDTGELLVTPAYEKSTKQVYLDAAKAMLQQHNEAKWVLIAVDHSSVDQVKGGLYPSWVPRWDLWSSHPIARPWTTTWYNGGLSSHPFIPSIRNSTQLVLKGIIFDKVVWTSDVLMSEYFSFDKEEWPEAFRDTGEPLISVLWQQVTAHLDEGHSDHLLTRFLITLARGFPSLPEMDEAFKGKLVRDYEAYREFARIAQITDPRSSTTSSIVGDPYFLQNYLYDLHNRRLACTEAGRLCIVPKVSEVGDICCLVRGLIVPFVLRARGDGQYHFVGDAYVEDAMSGSLLKDMNKEDDDEIVLV